MRQYHKYVILGRIPSKCMANAVCKRIFDDVFLMVLAERRICSSVFALYIEEKTPDVLCWA